MILNNFRKAALGIATFFLDHFAPIHGEGPSKNAMTRRARKAAPAVVLTETRQIRRARERAEKKGRKV